MSRLRARIGDEAITTDASGYRLEADIDAARFEQRLATCTMGVARLKLVDCFTVPESKGQAEFTRPPQDYVARDQLIRLADQGRVLRTKHTQTLAEVERQIGVDGPVVLGIWGRETAYGAHRATHYAVRVLATQAYTGRRQEMFRAELIAALRLLEDRILTVATMRSSWAGAMGLTQFMPTEFYQSGHDLDGDGRIDLFNSVPDALGSAAKQLKQKGWIMGLAWGFEVRPGANVDCGNDETTCQITCNGSNACDNVNCSNGACTVSCSGNGGCGNVDCRDSCSCMATCGTGSCGTVTCPMGCASGTGCMTAGACTTCP